MDRRYPTVQLVAGERGLELRLIAHLMGDDHDMTGDEAGTWLMSLWERVRSAAGLLAEYGIVAPVVVPHLTASFPQAPPSDTPPREERQIEDQAPALNGPARIPSVAERKQKGQADRALILRAMRISPGRWSVHEVCQATGLSTSTASWQLRRLKRLGLVRMEQTPGLGRAGVRWVLTEATGDVGGAAAAEPAKPAADTGAKSAWDIGAMNRQKGEVKRSALIGLMGSKPPGTLWSWVQLREGADIKNTSLGGYLRQLIQRGEIEMIHDRANGPLKRWRLTSRGSDHGFGPGEAESSTVGDGQEPALWEPEAEEAEPEEPGDGGPEPAAEDRLPPPVRRVTNVAQSIDVRQIQEYSAGKVFLMLGGTPRQETAEAIRVALKLKELRWPELRNARDLPLAMKEINRGDVALVLVNRFNRRCSRLYGHEARLIGKPVVMIPKGYGVVQVVHSIIDQWPPQWRRNGFGASGEIGLAVPMAIARR